MVLCGGKGAAIAALFNLATCSFCVLTIMLSCATNNNGGLGRFGRVELPAATGGGTSRNNEGRDRGVYTVFSTSCRPWQDWQSHALSYSHMLRGIEGYIVRLMSCDDPHYVLPRSSYGRYRVVRVPNFDALHPDDPYSPRNKANALRYWLSGESDDDVSLLPRDDDVVMTVDADMVFLSNQPLNLTAVRRGVGMASLYGLGEGWIRSRPWAVAACRGQCDLPDAVPGEASWGVPHVLTGLDARMHAEVWANLTEEVRSGNETTGEGDRGWITEMYTAVIAARRVGIRIIVERMMISNYGVNSEPWDTFGWYRSRIPATVPVAHYCQKYEIGNFWFRKHRDELKNNFDLRRCDKLSMFPQIHPDAAALEIMEKARGGPLFNTENTSLSEEELKLNRMVWLLDNTYYVVKKAMHNYYEEFCAG